MPLTRDEDQTLITPTLMSDNLGRETPRAIENEIAATERHAP
jgi:hypothetical protein